ncbi:hypothetical protein GUJ93_ZPchr0138g31 [Zizania palustris]|uniref:Uncharacterized protein n=1 Tax=Zizania palustris TaxID=103762 RepID=A0A8J5VEI9_ZIZPA|nr:hypothetical protein GUJ93_ZPchr0138g31 [Zizania palustris]
MTMRKRWYLESLGEVRMLATRTQTMKTMKLKKSLSQKSKVRILEKNLCLNMMKRISTRIFTMSMILTPLTGRKL